MSRDRVRPPNELDALIPGASRRQDDIRWAAALPLAPARPEPPLRVLGPKPVFEPMADDPWPDEDAHGAEPKTARPTPSIGTLTAADLAWGPPPPQLVPPFLDADGPTVLYGKGGAGKGVMTCWLAARLLEAGRTLMIVDFEGHEREWGSRLRGLGLPDSELHRVHYRAPFGADWTAATGALFTVAAPLRADCDRLGVTYLIVDSYSPATSSGDQLGGEQAAKEYFTGLTRIGRPSLTIAHVRGDAERFPERPFGSVFVHNNARETWAIASESDPDNDANDHTRPALINLELRNQKKSGASKARPQFVTVSFFGDGSLFVSREVKTETQLADLIAAVLEPGAMTAQQIAAALKEDGHGNHTADTINVTFKRHPDRFVREGAKRPFRWQLA